jgi:HEAT repeat protein
MATVRNRVVTRCIGIPLWWGYVYHPNTRGPAMKNLAIVALLAALTVPAIANPSEQLKTAIRTLTDGSDDEKAKSVRTIKELDLKGAFAVPALAEALKDGSPSVRVEVVKCLASYGPAAKEAIPALVTVVQEPRVDDMLFKEAVNAVAAVGDPGNPDVVRMCLYQEYHGRGGRSVSTSYHEYLERHRLAVIPVIAEMLTDPHRQTRKRAAISIAQLVTPSEGKATPATPLPPDIRALTVATLRIAIDEPDASVRRWAAAALLDLDPTSVPKAVPILLSAAARDDIHGSQMAALVRAGQPAARIAVESLDEPNPNVRQSIIGCLSQFGDGVLPVLAAGLRNPNPQVREGVLRVLQYANRAKKMRAEVVARLRDPEPRVRLAAATTLVSVDPKRADVVVPTLTELAFDPSRTTQVEALSVLRQLGPVARPAVPALLQRVRSGSFECRFVAAECLKEADRSTWRSFVPVFVAGLKADERWFRQRAINALRDTGPDARAALPALRQCFRDEDPLNRVAAAEAVFKIDSAAVVDVVACLTELLKETPGTPRRLNRAWRLTFRALEKIGPPAKAAVPALVELIRNDPDSGLAPDAAVLAIRLDPDNSGEAYEMFRPHLSPGNPQADEQWIYAISRLKTLSKPLLTELVATVSSKNASQKEAAIDALMSLGTDAKDVLPALREIARATKNDRKLIDVIAAIEKK